MSWKTRLLLRESLFTAAAFTLACYAYVFTILGIRDYVRPGPMLDYMESNAIHVEIIVTGLILGGLIGATSRFFETPALRDRPLVQLVALRTLVYLVGLGMAMAVVVGLLHLTILPFDEVRRTWAAITPRALASFGAWMVATVVGIHFLLEVERLVGPQNFWRLFWGRYRRPRDEERVFLFMDLENSTGTAEALGHRQYSAFIQECFRDLTTVVLRHEAVIYQYVGDEVVLSWPGHRARAPEKSVQTFFAYRDALAAKAESYRARYGAAPRFRGGIDVGPVTVVEVGDVKREIVYHGDVLNTAARLLEESKHRGDGLVVSRPVGDEALAQGIASANWEGELELRGKRTRVSAYGLEAPAA